MKVHWMRTGLSILAVYLGMRFLLPVVLPFLIALLVAKWLYPLAFRLETEHGWKHMTACGVVFWGTMAGIALVIGLICYMCCHVVCGYGDGIGRIGLTLMQAKQQLYCGLRDRLGAGAEPIISRLQTILTEIMGQGWEYVKNVGSILTVLGANLLVTVIAAFLILQDYQKIRQTILQNSIGKYMVGLFIGMKKAAGAYVKAEAKIMLLIMGICIVGLFLTGNRCAILVGILIGFFDALPFIGTGIILVPWAVFELYLEQYGEVVGLLVIYLICSLTRQILEPKLVGAGVGIAPLIILISIYIGIRIYGIGGVVLGPLSVLMVGQILNHNSDITER